MRGFVDQGGPDLVQRDRRPIRCRSHFRYPFHVAALPLPFPLSFPLSEPLALPLPVSPALPLPFPLLAPLALPLPVTPALPLPFFHCRNRWRCHCRMPPALLFPFPIVG